MSNEFYDHINAPATGSQLSSSVIRAELTKIEAGFDKLPALSAAANKLVVVNASGNALTSTDAPDINGGTIDGAPIGATTPGSGAFTTLSASSSATVPTVAADTNTTAAASTAFVLGQGGTATPQMDGSAAAGTSAKFSKGDHVHPTDTSRSPVASPTFTGVPAAPTAAIDTNTTQLATTAFVVAQAGSSSPVINGTATVGTSLRYSRQDHIHPTDTTRAPVASPTFTGSVTLPGDPSSNLHAATKAYVDGLATGIDTHTACECATTVNITLSGTQTIDGYSAVAGNRVLVKNQTNPVENGLYVCAAGAWSRATDADAVGEMKQGSYTFVNNGTVQQKTGWTIQTTGTITPGSTSITWAQFSSAVTYVAGTGLGLSGNTFNVTTVPVANGGTGVGTLSGLVFGNGTSNMSAASTAQIGTAINVTGIVKGAGSAALSAASGTDVTTLIGTNAVTNATNAGVTNDTTTNATMYPVWVTANTGNLPMKVTSTKLTFNPSTGMLTSTGFTGPLTGAATSAGTATTATNLAAGVAGAVPYQSGSGATAFSAAGTAGQACLSGGTGSPTWGTLGLSYGGTGATSAATARTALGVPATDGTGATGTSWPISITGSAGSATTASTATNSTQLGGVAAANYLQLSGGTLTGLLWGAAGGYPFNTQLAASGLSSPGVRVYRSDKTTLAGSAGTYGNNDVESYSYLGCGSDPWTTGIKVNTNGAMYNTVAGGSWASWTSRTPFVQAVCALADVAYTGLSFTTPSNGRFAAIDADPYTAIGSSTVMSFHVGTQTHAFQIWGSGSVVAAGNVTAYSDRKLKKDLEVIQNAMDKVSQLTGYTYTRIDTGERQSGLVAQDVQAVLPEVVMEAKDGTLSLAYGNIVGLLVEAIKELKAEIEELKK